MNNQGWQPIETAPKDGTEILVFVPKNKYTTQDHICVAFDFCGEWADDHGYDLEGITHWMPLPEGPKD